MAPTAPVRSLPVSQRQMVEIAKATDHDARVLILDEPTSALTEAETAILFGLLRALRARGVAIVFISHKLGEVKAIADRVTVLRDGALVATRAGRGAERGRHRATDGRPAAGASLSRQAPAGAGRPGAAGGRRPRRAAARCAAASFALRRGEILGFAGLVGAGRTELMEAMVGLRPRAGGAVRMAGQHAAAGPAARRRRGGLAYLTEDRRGKGLLLRLAPRPNLTLATLDRFRRGPFIDTAAEERGAGPRGRHVRHQDRRPGQPGAVAVGRQPAEAAVRQSAAGRAARGDGRTSRRAASMSAPSSTSTASSPTSPPPGTGVIVVSSEMPELIGLCHRVAVMRAGRIVGMLEGGGDHRGRDRPPRHRPEGSRLSHARRRPARGRPAASGAPQRPAAVAVRPAAGRAADRADRARRLRHRDQPRLPQRRQHRQRADAQRLHRHHRGRRHLRHHRRRHRPVGGLDGGDRLRRHHRADEPAWPACWAPAPARW